MHTRGSTRGPPVPHFAARESSYTGVDWAADCSFESSTIVRMSEPHDELQTDQPLDADSDPVEEVRPSLPAGTQIVIERFADGLTIQIPPAGLWRGTYGLFFFALIWNGFISVVTAAMLGSLLGGNAGKDNTAWIPLAFCSIFWLVGIILLLASLNMGRRRAAIAVTGGTLMIIQTGIFGSKQRDWEPGDVEAVRTGPSGMTVNDKPVLELQIYDGGASKFGILAGRRDEELRWLADTLREALGVPEQLS